jgi:predicted dehydrogenase
LSEVFAKDFINYPPSTRGQPDIVHILTAAATRNSASRAAEFLAEVKAPKGANAYGSYAALVADPDVDIVYVGTPHSHHYQHARMALEAGKHVLCEKAFTVNAEQARILIEIAREKKLFLMEAVWTRWFPVMKELNAIVKEGKLGEQGALRVLADLSFAEDMEKEYADGQSRMVNMDLAGGALLDCK